MDKEQFLTLTPLQRVEEVNRLLKNHTLKEISTMYNFAYSTFTTEMRCNGQYHYNKKSKQYVAVTSNKNQEEDFEILNYINENRHALQQLIDMVKSKNLLLNEKVYSKTATFENKSIKMNKSIYGEFTEFCDANYPHLKVQDLVAQSLLDFMERYKR